MNKSGLLQQFAHSTIAATLDLDAVRLFLLLLAAADSRGDGRISPATLQQALGCSLADLEEAISALTGPGLIEVLTSTTPAARRSCLCYRLLPIVGGGNDEK